MERGEWREDEDEDEEWLRDFTDSDYFETLSELFQSLTFTYNDFILL
jgi:hypothetical protein